MSLYWLVIGTLAVWRVTHLLQAEVGPWDIMVRFRRGVGSGFWGALLDCFYCLSLWISAPPALLIGKMWFERFILWLALSAGAILLERLTKRDEGLPPALYHEDPEESNVLLRKTEKTNQPNNSSLSRP
jgi:hypothetical protein